LIQIKPADRHNRFAAVAGMLGISCAAAICAAFGVGAATAAYMTEQVPAWALAIPVMLLLIGLLRCMEGETRAQVRNRPFNGTLDLDQ
jgi:hypothetical protein